jgi:hypothetical protein
MKEYAYIMWLNVKLKTVGWHSKNEELTKASE